MLKTRRERNPQTSTHTRLNKAYTTYPLPKSVKPYISVNSKYYNLSNIVRLLVCIGRIICCTSVRISLSKIKFGLSIEVLYFVETKLVNCNQDRGHVVDQIY